MENCERQKVQRRKPFGYDLETHWATDQTMNDIYSPLFLLKVSQRSALNRKLRLDDLNICEVQNGLLIRNHIKLHRFPHSVAKQVAHFPFPGDDYEVHPCTTKNKTKTCVMVIKNTCHTIKIEWKYRNIIITWNLPATRRIVPMIPQMGLVTPDGGMSLIP